MKDNNEDYYSFEAYIL